MRNDSPSVCCGSQLLLRRGAEGNPSVCCGSQLPLHSSHRLSSSSCAGVAVGLFSEKSTPYSFLQNARPPGSLRSPSEPRTVLPFLCAFPVGLFSVCAPNQLFKLLRCSAWLIQLRQRTALSPLKRSCFRFASLTLRTAHRSPVSSPLAAAAALWLPCVRGAVRRRAGLRGCLRIRGKGEGQAPFPSLRTEPALRAAPVFRSAYSASRNARPPAASRPPSKHTVLFLPKRSCFRFASLTLRLRTETFFQKVPVFRMAYFAIPHRIGFSSRSGVPVGLFGKPKRTTFSRFAASIEAHRAVSSKTLMLQPLRGLRTPHRSPVSSPLAAAAD